MSGGGGQALVRNGDECRMGWLTKFSPTGGTGPPPPGKPCSLQHFHVSLHFDWTYHIILIAKILQALSKDVNPDQKLLRIRKLDDT